MAREKVKVEIIGKYSYERQAYVPWETEVVSIYKMLKDDGEILVWKTTGGLGNWKTVITPKGQHRSEYEGANKGDKVVIQYTVKEQSEYKGEPQTIVTRVKLVEIIEKGPSWEEIQEQKEAERQKKKEKQLASIKDGDMIYNMPYRQYKEHYADCETVIGSYNSVRNDIDVIVRAGRLKASGVRFKRFSHWCFENEKGEKYLFYAVSKENAEKQLKKLKLEGEWKFIW